MRSTAVFKDIARTQSLERYLFSQTEGLVNKCFGPEKKPHLVVKVFQDRHREQSGASHYVCELLLTLKDHAPVLKVHKSGYDFYECVAEAGAALRQLIRRQHSRDVYETRHAQPMGAELESAESV